MKGCVLGCGQFKYRGMCLTLDDQALGRQVMLSDCRASASNQQFALFPEGDGVHVRARHSRLCVEVTGAGLVQLECTGVASQRFRVVDRCPAVIPANYTVYRQQDAPGNNITCKIMEGMGSQWSPWQ